jgi:hypothetical protein
MGFRRMTLALLRRVQSTKSWRVLGATPDRFKDGNGERADGDGTEGGLLTVARVRTGCAREDEHGREHCDGASKPGEYT